MRWTKGAEDTVSPLQLPPPQLNAKLTVYQQLWQTVFKTQSFHIDLVEVSREWRTFFFTRLKLRSRLTLVLDYT
ncbi:hypothetical protein BDV18DRAFT_147397 [Aspergillus unguis]